MIGVLEDPFATSDLIKCRIEIISHWKNLYGSIPNDKVIEASIDWFCIDIWPNIDGTEHLPFTWSAANKLMSDLCPFWIKQPPSLELVILMIGVLEDPFATCDLINRVPTLVRTVSYTHLTLPTKRIV